MRGKRWTLEDKLLLSELFGLGHTVNYVARQLERTPMSVVGMAWKLGVSVRWKQRGLDHGRQDVPGVRKAIDHS